MEHRRDDFSARVPPRAASHRPTLSALAEQTAQIKRTGEHLNASIRAPRPFFTRTIMVEFDSVTVRVAQIERFAHAMIARAIERNVCVDQPLQRICQGGPRGI